MWNQCAVLSARLDCSGGRRRRARQAGAAKSLCAFVLVGGSVFALCRPDVPFCSSDKQSGAEQQIYCLLESMELTVEMKPFLSLVLLKHHSVSSPPAPPLPLCPLFLCFKSIKETVGSTPVVPLTLMLFPLRSNRAGLILPTSNNLHGL